MHGFTRGFMFSYRLEFPHDGLRCLFDRELLYISKLSNGRRINSDAAPSPYSFDTLKELNVHPLDCRKSDVSVYTIYRDNEWKTIHFAVGKFVKMEATQNRVAALYSPSCRIGNWQEELFQQRQQLDDYMCKKQTVCFGRYL